MLFNSIEYIFIFLPIVFTIYFFINKLKLFSCAKIFLIISSLYFYGSYKREYVFIIIFSICINYFFSHIIYFQNKKNIKKYFLGTAIISNIFLLIFFKYFNSLYLLYIKYIHTGTNIIEIIIPIGISFFTLQQISFLIDSYKGISKKINFIDYSLFISFFPQLIVGPIVRQNEIIHQFNNPNNKNINQDNLFVGLFLLTIGLLKKVIIADSFNSYINFVIGGEHFNNFYVVWLLGILKVLQGYFDFSGYCDMALGSAYMFNIILPWNFNSPYKAVSILDYWKRWNKTLIRFLQDYIYKPLGGNKKSKIKTYRNIFITFLVYACWKGSNPINFVYGVLNGILVCICKFLEYMKIKIYKPVSISITFITIVFLSTFIQSKNFLIVFQLIKTMLGINADYTPLSLRGINIIYEVADYVYGTVSIPILILALYSVFFMKNSTQLSKTYIKSNNIIYTCILAIVFVFSVLSITKSSEFLYFIF
jgi:D-alanyl-lipoteichoic acid acyltransferase DltB (MBOAT superfamily)